MWGQALLRTPAGKAFAAPNDRRIYLVWIAFVWAGMIVGFGPDLSRYAAETPPPPLILNLHGFAYFTWLVLVTLQVALIEVRKPGLHKTLGWWVVGVSVALVPLGFAATMVDMAREAAHTPYKPEFIGLEFLSLIIFPILLLAATLLRHDLAAHKRLMMLLLVVFLDPGTSRAWDSFSPIHPGGTFGWWLEFYAGNALLLIAMMGWDIWRHGRVHPALLTGGALLAAGEAAAVFLEFSPWWHVTAAHLVTAWGWTG